MQINGLNPISGFGDALGGQELGRFEFLQLLVAQLANQDPLEPVDNTEFVSQVAQFSSLDELIKIRQLNESSMALMTQLLEAGLIPEETPTPPTVPGDGETTPDPGGSGGN